MSAISDTVAAKPNVHKFLSNTLTRSPHNTCSQAIASLKHLQDSDSISAAKNPKKFSHKSNFLHDSSNTNPWLYCYADIPSIARCMLAQNTLQSAPMHPKTASGFRYITATLFIDTLDMLPAHPISAHGVTRRRWKVATGLQ